MDRHALAVMADEERRYDVLPPWAWRTPVGAEELVDRKIAALERLIRENDRALAENVSRLARLRARHRQNRDDYATELAALKRIRSGSPAS